MCNFTVTTLQPWTWSDSKWEVGLLRCQPRSWKGFDQPGPYAIQFADDLRMKMAAIESIQSSDQNRTRIIFDAREEASDQLALSQRTERQLQEQADTALTPQEKRTALRNENIRSRTEAEKVAYLGSVCKAYKQSWRRPQPDTSCWTGN